MKIRQEKNAVYVTKLSYFLKMSLNWTELLSLWKMARDSDSETSAVSIVTTQKSRGIFFVYFFLLYDVFRITRNISNHCFSATIGKWHFKNMRIETFKHFSWIINANFAIWNIFSGLSWHYHVNLTTETYHAQVWL